MFAEERQRKISELVAREGKLSVAQLQGTLQASPATIRRDLTDLEDRGEIVRVHGGVMHPSFFYGEPTFSHRKLEQPVAKGKIAQLAASIPTGRASVFVDAGTTALEVGKELIRREDLTIFTHSLPLVMLAPKGKARVVCIGGEVRSPSLALIGGLGLDWLARLHFDYAFVGASGLAEKDGATTTELGEAAIKQAVIQRTKFPYLVCDYSKWDSPRSVFFAGWDKFTAWIVDIKPPARCLKATGVKVIHPTGKE